MYTDMVGYTALGQRSEFLSLALVEEQRKIIRPVLARHNGKEIKTMGDAFLVEFPNALDAVRCAYDIQRATREFNFSLPEDKRIHLRVGLHLGDVVESEGDISGDAVNVASRIEPLARDGGICLTRQIYESTHNKFEAPLVSIGMKSLRNVTEPMEVYRMEMPWEKASAVEITESPANRIAVLPFANMSPHPNDEYFADGMTDEVISTLSRLSGIEVISRTSVMQYKKNPKPMREVSKELNVGTILEGSVRKAGNRLRITAQMIDATRDRHLWVDTYDRNLQDIFAVQSEIAEKLAGELKVQLLKSEKETLKKKPTENMEAYGDFLRGRELYRELSEPSLRQALKLFERAVELDPSFARAHVGVAESHEILGNAGYEPYDVMLPAVRASLKCALELDPNLAEAHAALALMHLNEDDLPGEEAEARRALEINPSLPEAYDLLFEVAGVRGQPEEMVKNMEIAYRLDPIRPRYISLLGYVYFATGREQEALEHWGKTEHLAPAETYRNMADYYLSKGDIAKARELHAKYEKLQPTNPWVIYMGGFIDATAGDREKALLAIRTMENRKMGPIAYNYVAYIYHALGDMNRYFENMNRALEEHVLIAIFVLYSPLLARAREDPRYRELVEKLRRMNGLAK